MSEGLIFLINCCEPTNTKCSKTWPQLYIQYLCSNAFISDTVFIVIDLGLVRLVDQIVSACRMVESGMITALVFLEDGVVAIRHLYRRGCGVAVQLGQSHWDQCVRETHVTCPVSPVDVIAEEEEEGRGRGGGGKVISDGKRYN